VANRELVVLGTASQAPTRRRGHNGYLLRWDGAGVLFDPGEGTQRQMLFAGVTSSQVTCICLTHLHGDHCLGLPGVLLRMTLDEVTHTVDLCYPAVSADVLARLRHAAIFRRAANIRDRPVHGAQTVLETAGFAIEARPLSHSAPAVGYRLAEPDGRRMIPARLAALGIAGPDVGRLQRDGELAVGGRRVTLAQVSEPRPGQRVAFVMDTRLCDGAFELAQGADLLICESTFADGEERLAREYGHLTARHAGRLAAAGGARRLVLTHFSQRYDHDRDGGARLAGQAAEEFGGDIVLANDLDRIEVPARP
jgi:ribonuclease Z